MTNPKVLLVANTDWYLFRFRLPLAKHLLKMGFSVKFVSPKGPFVPRLTDKGFQWIEWQVGRQSTSPAKEWRALRQLKEIYISEQPTVVHHHTIKPVLYGSYLAQQVGVEAIINSITGSGYVFMSKNLKARLLKPLVLVLYKKALSSSKCAVIFENPEDQADFVKRRLIRPEQTWLVRSVGVDVEKFLPSVEPTGTPVVTLASRMLWDKGVGVFIEAARLLQNRTKVRMVLVGVPDPGNPSSVPLEQLEAWVDEGVVEWMGWQEDIGRVYAQSNIVALPSFYEGLPTSLIEAAACGRAIIASDIPGCREVITHGENGLLTPPGNPAALADAIERLANDPPLRRDMGLVSRKRAVAEFSTDEVNQKTVEIYKKYLKNGF